MSLMHLRAGLTEGTDEDQPPHMYLRARHVVVRGPLDLVSIRSALHISWSVLCKGLRRLGVVYCTSAQSSLFETKNYDASDEPRRDIEISGREAK